MEYVFMKFNDSSVIRILRPQKFIFICNYSGPFLLWISRCFFKAGGPLSGAAGKKHLGSHRNVRRGLSSYLYLIKKPKEEEKYTDPH